MFRHYTNSKTVVIDDMNNMSSQDVDNAQSFQPREISIVNVKLLDLYLKKNR
jgi:hypothetical protein